MFARLPAGYVLLHRKLLGSDVWQMKSDYLRVAVASLLMANWKDGEFRGRPVKRGEFITSIPNMAQTCGLTPKVIRRAWAELGQSLFLEKLSKRADNFTHIRIVNYDTYQLPEVDEGRERAELGQSLRSGLGQKGAAIEERKKEEYKKSQAQLSLEPDSQTESDPLRKLADDYGKRLWNEQNSLRRETDGDLRSLAFTESRRKAVLARLRDQAKAHHDSGKSWPDAMKMAYGDCRHVLAVYAAEATSSGESKYFNGETNWRDGNFQRALGRKVERAKGEDDYYYKKL